jgi:hypothetical protein
MFWPEYVPIAKISKLVRGLYNLIAFSTPVELGRGLPTTGHDAPLCARQDLGGLEGSVNRPQPTMRCGIRCANDLCMVSPTAFQGTVPGDVFEHMASARPHEWTDEL